jgi:sarcosine oxidase delta subunit
MTGRGEILWEYGGAVTNERETSPDQEGYIYPDRQERGMAEEAWRESVSGEKPGWLERKRVYLTDPVTNRYRAARRPVSGCIIVRECLTQA